MAEIIPVFHNLSGFQSDVSREELGPTYAFRMRDWIPQLEAPLRKRGGWSFGSPNLSSIGGTAASVASIGFLPFPGDGRLAAVSNAGSVYALERFDGSGGSLITDTGDATIVPSWPVFFHKTGTKYYGIILPGFTQSGKVPKKFYDTGSLAYQVDPLGGTPPLARMGFSWGDYLVLGNYYDPSSPTVLYNYRWAYSAVGNPDSWTLTGTSASTIDFPEEVVAGIPMKNLTLAWGYNDCHIVTGDTPPPGGNLARKTLWAGQGTFDGRSAVPWRDQAVWANAGGVFMSDGATLVDLTYQGGISVYYRQLVAGFTFSQGWSATAGIYRDRYILTIRNASGTVLSTLVCDLTHREWSEWTNFPGGIYAHRPAGPGTSLYGGDEELFFAHGSLPYVGVTSSLWTPRLTYAYDADGTAVLPSLETGFYKIGSDYIKRFRRLFIGADIRTAGASPYLSFGYVTSPESGLAYTPMTDTFPTTTRYKRKQMRVGKFGLGLGLEITQVGASADTRIYDGSVEAYPTDPTRAGI